MRRFSNTYGKSSLAFHEVFYLYDFNVFEGYSRRTFVWEMFDLSLLIYQYQYLVWPMIAQSVIF